MVQEMFPRFSWLKCVSCSEKTSKNLNFHLPKIEYLQQEKLLLKRIAYGMEMDVT